MSMKLYNEENVRSIANAIRNRGVSILPEEYQQVECIESTGTQYIDTGFKPNQDTRVVCEFQAKELKDYIVPFGSRDNENLKSFFIGMQYPDNSEIADWFIRYGSKTTLIKADGKLVKYSVDFNKQSIKLNNKEFIFEIQVFQALNNIYIFGNNLDGFTRGGSFAIYSFKIYDNNVLVRDYIPCYRKSDNEIGLYDLAENKFYTNAGTGTFLKGQNQTIYHEIQFKLREMPSAIKSLPRKDLYEKALASKNTTTAAGNPMYLADSADMPFKNPPLPQGNTEQETYEGYNLLPPNRGDKIDYFIPAKTKLTLLTKDGVPSLGGNVRLYDVNNEVIWMGIDKDTTSRKITLSRDIYKIENWLTEGIDHYLTIGEDLSKPYEPFVGGKASPNPDYPQEVKCVGQNGNVSVKIHNKNFFDKDNFEYVDKKRLDDNGNVVADNDSSYSTTLYKVNPNTNYIIQGTNSVTGKATRINFYTDEKKFIMRSSSYSVDTYSFTTPNNCYYIGLQLRDSANLTLNKIQIEQDTTATEYTPHAKQNFTIPTQKEFCKIENNADTFLKQDGTWYEKHYINKIVLDGSGEWTTYIHDSTKARIFRKAVNELKTSRNNKMLCSHFKVAPDMYTVSNYTFANRYANFYNLEFGNNDITTVNEWKQWLSQNPVTIYYLLSTPELIECTPEQVEVLEQIEEAVTYADGTHITATSENANPILEVEYYKTGGEYQEKTITPSVEVQTIIPDEGYDGLSKVNVNAVTAEIDNNIKSENIKKDVTILGVTGTLESGGGTGFTGHYDAEGLKQIGWTDEDIEYYQKNGVVWNEEDDDAFKLTESELLGDNTANTRFIPKNTTLTSFRNFRVLIGIPKIDISKVTSMYNMFSSCYSLTSIPKIDTSKVASMNNMFSSCYSLTSIPKIDTSKVANMENMFNECYSLTTIPEIDTSKVTNMTNMFRSCYALKTIPKINTNSVTKMAYMFGYCYSLTSIPKMDTSKVTDMNNMFYTCRALKTIPEIDASSVTNINNMFANCLGLVNLLGFKNLGMAYLTTSAASYSYYKLNLVALNLTHESIMNVINNLYDIATKGCNAQELGLGATNLAKLSEEEIAIATTKGWTVT